MTTPTPEKLITGEEFERMPESRDHELIDGRLVPVMAAGGKHGKIVIRIGGRLDSFVSGHILGEVGGDWGFWVRRHPDRMRAPDVAFIPAERIPEDGLPNGFMGIVPVLAVEVVSPNELDHEVDAKVLDFFAFGVERVWLVRSFSRTVTVLTPDGGAHRYSEGETLTSDDAGFPIEGFTLPVTDIFS
jgi:Uma2 family endonuclease